MLTSLAVAGAVCGGLWWVLSVSGDEAPLVPAALTAGIILLVAAAAREVVMRRAWRRYALEMQGREERARRSPSSHSGSYTAPHTSAQPRAQVKTTSVHASASALRTLHQRLAEAEAAGAEHPAAHLEAYRLCEQYLSNIEETVRSNKAAPDARLALRAGQERVLELQKHHLLSWARGETKLRTQEARRRVRLSDKIETAQGAMDVIEEALRVYPDEPELHESAAGLRDFIASVRIAHWVELAERAAFRGRYARAIARYSDALFFVSRSDMTEGARAEAANRIGREIEMLRANMATSERPVKKSSDAVRIPAATEDDGNASPRRRPILEAEILPATPPSTEQEKS